MSMSPTKIANRRKYFLVACAVVALATTLIIPALSVALGVLAIISGIVLHGRPDLRSTSTVAIASGLIAVLGSLIVMIAPASGPNTSSGNSSESAVPVPTSS